jgi:hypothetical protein
MPSLIKHDDLILRLVKDVNDIRSMLRRTVANLPLFDISNENTPPMITADQNDYVPGNYDVLRLSSNAPWTITGFRGGVKGRFLRLVNVGAYEIAIAHESYLSTIGNRVRSSTGFNIVINAGGEIVLYYDFSVSEWRTSYSSNADRLSVELRLDNPQSIPDSTYEEIVWTRVVKDTGGFFDASAPTLVTIPETGWYDVNGCVTWDVGTGERQALVRSFPSTYLSLSDVRSATSVIGTCVNMGRKCYLPKGLTVLTRVWHNNGSATNVSVNGDAALGTALIISKA